MKLRFQKDDIVNGISIVMKAVPSKTTMSILECILIDDCTPDNSIKIANQLIEKYTGDIQFKIIRHTQNRGAAAVRNTGLEASQVHTYPK